MTYGFEILRDKLNWLQSNISMNNQPPLFVMGDIHGYLDALVRHMQLAGLATPDAEWTGRDAQLWFMGDFTDRGPDGVGVIDYVMRMQADAERKGGKVGALLGNHDVGILTAKLFPKAPTDGAKGAFYADWYEYGGTFWSGIRASHHCGLHALDAKRRPGPPGR